jgi:hypothetical protein
LRKYFIDLDFMLKLLSFKLARLWDLDHNKRMDLIDKRDASMPNPVHARELLLDTHCEGTFGAGGTREVSRDE